MQPKLDDPTEFIPRVAAPPTRRRGSRWLAVGLATAVLVVGSGIAVTWHRAAAERGPKEPVAVATATIDRRDLSTTRTLPGAIGFGAARPLSGHLAATVTWLPTVGSTVKRGGQLFRADDRPVVLFYGSMPMYRDIAGLNLVGRDVAIVADNLRTLGYSIGRQPSPGARVTPPPPAAPSTIGKPAAEADDGIPGGQPGGGAAGEPHRVRSGEGVLTPALIAAIKRWQTDLGVPATGTIPVGHVEVSSGAVRVDSIIGQPGAPAQEPLMSVTPVRKVITVGAELAHAASIKRGDRVTVGLPDDRTVSARVVSVGRALVAAENGPATGPQLLTVTVSVDKPQAIAGLDAGEVQVHFVGRTAVDVLVAPVEALVALREGGYAVQTPSGLVAVSTGMFADGLVEITGDGLTEGVEVVVPA
ncbi:efflux RND transporter periplasmic adaptor subunit [Micromonospora andamanensis]|uniref:Peptidoglycan-binding protein n=1 Tax=Micromonospora andamanensis TaxID=1287068 RepID=A0ABQ4HV70_9ACTN|nr:efflux RND transporter periplasmic adaptor subunit [Micromonospora andamanensis]GIJ09522.1 peptidoglycan-binding protein [Micromonospora andamanensis]